jgi:hypothetical protein
VPVAAVKRASALPGDGFASLFEAAVASVPVRWCKVLASAASTSWSTPLGKLPAATCHCTLYAKPDGTHATPSKNGTSCNVKVWRLGPTQGKQPRRDSNREEENGHCFPIVVECQKGRVSVLKTAEYIELKL